MCESVHFSLFLWFPDLCSIGALLSSSYNIWGNCCEAKARTMQMMWNNKEHDVIMTTCFHDPTAN